MNLSTAALAAVLVLGSAAAAHARDAATVPADKLRLSGPGRATEGGGWNLWSNGSLGDWFEAAQDGEVEVTALAAGSVCQGVWTLARWWVRGESGEEPLGPAFSVGSADFKEYSAKTRVKKGRFAVLLEFTNDGSSGKEDRNLYLRELRVKGARLLEKIPSIRESCDEGIRRHRLGRLTVQAAPGAAVKVTQLRHEFLFGTAIAHQVWNAAPDVKEKYLKILKENFNHAVHENALKWYHTERNPGPPNYADAERVLSWCEENGITMRGHCVYWGVEQFVNPWLKKLDDAALRAALEKRGKEVAARFKGRIREYDLNNEMIHDDYYRRRLGPGITKEMFLWTKSADPAAVLYVNDYNIMSGNEVLKYVEHIKALIDQGAPVGGIGDQAHFGGGVVDGWHVRAVLDQLARFKLPIKLTEFDVNSPDEARKVETLETVYRVSFAHPAVEGILMWGFWEGAHWIPKAALWKRDFSPTPSAEAYRNLVFKEWWTAFEGQADASGKCEVPAFFGRHAVESGGKRVEVDLKKVEGRAAANLR
jgi:GH35 family endo-1,4-beta-xylanase